MSGLVFFLAGPTPHADQTLYPLFALLSVAIGGALALRVISTAGLFHLMAVGLGLWLLNLSNVLLGAQTFAGWLDSGFIAATVLGGRLLLGHSLVSVPAPGGSSTVVQSR